MHFPISGVEINPLIPPLVAFLISLFTSMGGVSGAFMLLPFQMSVLGYVSPSVSATNQLYNVFATPSGVYRYTREGRLLWPLSFVVIVGTLPGICLGAWLRVHFLPDWGQFRFFAAFVLLLIAFRLLQDILLRPETRSLGRGQLISDAHLSFREIRFRFAGETYRVRSDLVFLFSLMVSVLGGAYGIGGGAIMSPFLVGFMGLPVYVVAGAAMLATLVSSVVGVIVYEILGRFYPELSVSPDYWLGLAFGVGGFCGIYVGSRCQRYVSARAIKMILILCTLVVALRYLAG